MGVSGETPILHFGHPFFVSVAYAGDCFTHMKVTEFAFVAYPVTDLTRARAFYEGVLGLRRETSPKDADARWFEYEVGPHTLGIGQSPQWKPSSDGPSLALEVEDFQAAVEHLKHQGVAFRMGPFETPVCHMVVVKDPDGNKITIHKRKERNKAA